jgi:hypothetical protein
LKHSTLKKQAFFAAGGIAAVLTLLFHFFYNSAILFYLLFPGLMIGLLITGGHGGTRTEEAIAPIAAFVVNFLFYFMFAVGVLQIRRKLTQ